MEFIQNGPKFGTSLTSGLLEDEATSDSGCTPLRSSPKLQVDGDELDTLIVRTGNYPMGMMQPNKTRDEEGVDRRSDSTKQNH